MKESISSTSFSTLVNGSPSHLFKAPRGLRHGDPWSPFIFIVVVEDLRALLTKAKDLGLIRAFEVG